MDHELSRVHRGLMEGRAVLPAVVAVVTGPGVFLPWVVHDGAGREVEPVSSYLQDRMLGDVSPLTCRSYAYDLLRWFRMLWTVDVGWEQATEAETAALVGWLRSAGNPQRRRRGQGGPPPGSVNPVTGKQVLAAGYAPATIGHNLTAVHGFYAFHLHFGRGPVVNPVPENTARRKALAHRSPIEPVPGIDALGCDRKSRCGVRGRSLTNSGTGCSRGCAVTGTGHCWPATSPPVLAPRNCC